MDHLKPAEKAYWESYLASLPSDQRPSEPTVSASYAGNAEITDELLELYLSGRKVSGSSILEDFLSANDEPPKAGNFWIYLNGRGDPACILKTIKVVQNRFGDLPAEIAKAEGEGDGSLAHWRKVHQALYEPHLKAWGLARMEDATVITEFFQIVFR